MRAKCHRSQRKNEVPHDLLVHFSEDRIEHWSCSCAVGNLLCHHITGLLYQFAHYQQLKLACVPEIESQTSRPQARHIPSRKKGVAPRPIGFATIQKAKKKKMTKKKQTCVEGVSSTLYNAVSAPLMSIQMRNEMLPALSCLDPTPQYVQVWSNDKSPDGINTIFGTVPKGSVLSYQLAPLVAQDVHSHIVIPDVPPPPHFDFPNLSQRISLALPFEQYNLYNSLCITTAEALQIEEDTRVQSASAKWFKLRRPRLTASLFKRVCSRRGDFESLAQQLIGGGNGIQTRAMKL